jgi:hypothetical protein
LQGLGCVLKIKKRKKPVMIITRRRGALIGRLSEQLASIAPSTSPGNGFCVQRIAEQMNLKNTGRNRRTKG